MPAQNPPATPAPAPTNPGASVLGATAQAAINQGLGNQTQSDQTQSDQTPPVQATATAPKDKLEKGGSKIVQAPALTMYNGKMYKTGEAIRILPEHVEYFQFDPVK
jgi:hypothetical protein